MRHRDLKQLPGGVEIKIKKRLLVEEKDECEGRKEDAVTTWFVMCREKTENLTAGGKIEKG